MTARLLIFPTALILLLCGSAKSQIATNPKPVPIAPPLPFTTQLKKTVVFITTNCLHQPTPEERARMEPANLAKLKPEEQAEWQHELSGDLTPEEFAKMTPAQRATVRFDPHSGTGFIVFVPDGRAGKDQGFQYLVTNRHVVQPGIEHGSPCDALEYRVALNHKGDTVAAPVHAVVAGIYPTTSWMYPSDSAVDIAVVPISVPESEWDIMQVPVDIFATPEMIEHNEIVEGDPVVFAGLFIQYSGGHRLNPVVRSGSIAMLPDDLVPTTLGMLGRVYLAEAHTFGGNSGSPMFVDVNKFKNVLGSNYRLLGIVTGEVFETNNFTLQVTTSYNLNVAANSDVSMIVPADEIRSVLYSASLQQSRDKAIADLHRQPPSEEFADRK
jgi:hypothetical protein